MTRFLSTSRFIALAAIFGLLLFALAGTVFAQTETGQVVGTVTDPTGAVVLNAKVTVTNVATGAKRTSQTNGSGEYAVTNLLPGTYSVLVEAPNFAKAQGQVVITVGSRIASDFKLVVGNATTTVEVSTAAVAVNTETQTLSSTIDAQGLSQLPTLTRNPYALVVTSGNVSEDDPSGPSGRGAGVSINGLRAAGTNILLDGSANNDEFIGGVGQNVPLDSVQELSIITNNFTAEYGRASAGIVNVATKNGTNAFHGTAYEFNRVAAFASNTSENNANGLPKAQFTRNQFGYSIGGPIKKDKLFFFNNTEWIRVRSQAPFPTLIPTQAFIAQTNTNTQTFFGALGLTRPDLKTLVPGYSTKGGANDICTGPVCSAAVAANTPLFDEVVYNHNADSGGGLPQNTYESVGRVDLNISERTQFYSRYAIENGKDFAGTVDTSPYAGYETGQNTRNQNILLSLTHNLSSRVVSQSKFVFNRLNVLQPLGASPVVPTLYMSSATTGAINGIDIAFPGYNFNTPGSAIPFGGPQNFFQLYQDLNVQKGAHQLRFGGNYTYIIDNRAFGAYQEAVETLSNNTNSATSMDNFVAGQLSGFQAAVYPQGKFPCPYPLPGNPPTPGQPCGSDVNGDGIVGNDPGEVLDPLGTINLPVGPPNFSRSNRYSELGAYFEDSWKMKPNFTLNLGLRWEYFGVQHNVNPNLDSNYYDGTGGSIFDQIRNGDVALAPQSAVHGLWAKDWSDFAPRLGFAWDIFGDGKTSLRGGWGVGYERNFGNVTFNVIQNPPNYAVISINTGSDVPVGSLPITTNNAGPLGGSSGIKAIPKTSLRNVNPHIKTAYAHLFSLSLEREVARNLVASVQYSGSKGERLYSIENPNRPGSGNVYLGDDINTFGLTRLRTTQYSNINRRGGNGYSNYNALNLKLESKNFKNSGLTLSANYTYSHTLDNLSSSFSESAGDFNLGLLDPFNPKLDYGSSEFDNRQRIGLGAVWELPFGRQTSGVVNRILGGWTIAPVFSARTGAAFTEFDCFNAFSTCPRAQINGSIPKGRQGAVLSPNDFSYIDWSQINAVSDWTSADSVINGNSCEVGYCNPIVGLADFGPFPANMTRRGAFRGPGAYDLDLGVYKTFKLTEKYSLQLRAESYNLLNHSNLYVQTEDAEIGTGLGACGATTCTLGSLDAKRGTPPINVILGNPGGYERRNLQLAAKFIF
jgi:outer membrane receptor protein involved in Fe transport